MDLTSKGKSWAGSIYHQFESICHDVDGFMTKDTLQFVENQAQSVGKSVKRLYSSVKDMIPPLEEDSDRLKSEAQQVRSDEDEINDQINGGSLENSLASLTFVENKTQTVEPDSCPDAKTNAVREEHHNHIARTDCVDMTASSSSDAKKDRTSFITFSDYTDGFSDASTSGWSFEDNFPSFQDPKSTEDKIPSPPTVSFADKACQRNDSAIDSHTSSEFESTDKGLKEETTGHNILTMSYSNISKSLSESTKSFGDVKCDDHSSDSLHPETSKAIDWLPSELSNITHVADIDGEMETIDLSTDAKPDRTAIVLDSNLGRTSLSYRRKDFRYYKGLVKDAIASRKRLSKEYEQFAIMYGDIDEELLRDFEQHSSPSSPSEMVENEWELL